MYRGKYHSPAAGRHIFLVLLALLLLFPAAVAIAAQGTQERETRYIGSGCVVREVPRADGSRTAFLSAAGAAPVYLRASVVVTFRDGEGRLLPETPEAGVDYEITFGEDWGFRDGYFYWTEPVSPGSSTKALVERFAPLGATDGEIYLRLDILPESSEAGWGVWFP